MRNNPTTDLGKRIQRIVDEKGINKKDFARSLGISQNYLYQIIMGAKTSISPSLAKLIEALYGYPAGWVLSGSLDVETRSELIEKLKHMDMDKVHAVKALLEELE